MELLASANEYLVVNGDFCLRCSRTTGVLTVSNAVAVAEQVDPVCLGIVYGVIGRVEFTSNGPSYLILIKEQKQIAKHPLKGEAVYKIEKVVAIPLTTADPSIGTNGTDYISELQLVPCPKHRANGDSSILRTSGVIAGFSLFQKGQKKMAKATVDSLKFVTNKMNVRINSGTKLNEMDSMEKDRIRVERRLVLELLRMFNESGSFYYCPNADLTNTVQRLTTKDSSKATDDLDMRFFWNFYMLRDLLQDTNSSLSSSLVCPWVIPIIQGYIGVEDCFITIGDDSDQSLSPRPREPAETFHYQLMVISRRSIHRAGTRYIKRGIDIQGNCANYVETEQIMLIGEHALAFVQTRGSVPVYWSQPGYRYKPPPKLDRSKVDSTLAFRKHFDEQLSLYSNVVAINLVEQSGKEKILSDAYIDHVLDLDSDNIAYVGFDFHEHCRGLKFENVMTLTSALEDQLSQMRFCWSDKGSMNCSQNGVFRVNCVDCLDRTNVIQSALGKLVLELQLRKFGLLPPEQTLPPNCVQAFQLLWACNGDAISRQYAGTAALKGDFTRTGQRNFAGLMKDGYNSANRYYLCHMKDARRQAVIDALLGRQIVENDRDLENLVKPNLDGNDVTDEASWLKEKDEQLRLFVRDCERLVVPEGEVVLGGWAFINADPGVGDETEDDMDTCVILTRQAYYVADYDEDLDKFVDFQRIPLENISRIEVGPMTVAAVLGVPKTKATCIRIYYTIVGDKENYFHVWRSGSTRLFNNLAIAIKSPDEADEYMKAIAEQFRVALELMSREIAIIHASKLERKRSKIPPEKAVFRRSQSVFGGPPVFFVSLTSSVGGGMKSFGNRVTSAFSNQSGNGMKFPRIGSNRKSNLQNGNIDGKHQLQATQAVPLVTLQQADGVSLYRNALSVGPAYNCNAGLLFGAVVTPQQRDSPKLCPRRRSVGQYPNSGDAYDRCITPSSELLQSNLGSPLDNKHLNLTVSPDPNIDSTSIATLSPLFPVPASGGTCRSSMKTSRSETTFKPLQVDSPSLSVGGQRSLATSQTALNRSEKGAQNAGSSILNFSFFKRKPLEGDIVAGDRNRFSQFQDRIKNSKTKFILL